MKIVTHEIFDSLFEEKSIRVFMRRLDLISNPVSGNKYFKLKYNISHALEKKYSSIITFGGAYSNHILATSIICNQNKLRSIGYIRGEEKTSFNPTLKEAIKNGMEIKYLNRKDYSKIKNEIFLKNLLKEYKNYYLLPEGGTNNLAIAGAEEILELNEDYQYICCPVGTGGTISGIINKSSSESKVIGFSSLKGINSLKIEIEEQTNKKNWIINEDYSGKGYAKISKDLIDFINIFFREKKIILDAVYTAKMVMGIYDLVKKKYFKNGSRILIVHTGGVQGNRGMNKRFNLNLPHNF